MNIQKAKQEFLKFANQYDLTFPKMKRKLDHSFRVMNNSENIAKSLNLSNEEIELATLIGLLHDIGHFEEIKEKDILKKISKIDHGDLGVKILKNENYLRKYIEENRFDNIILKAIKNHNKFIIETDLSKEELLFAKIIRDADKLDIFYEGAEMFWTKKEQIDEINNSKISDEVIQNFAKHIYCDRKNIKTKADSIIQFISLIFDITFKYDFEVIKKEDYINKILNKFDFKDVVTSNQIKLVQEIASQYINNKL